MNINDFISELKKPQTLDEVKTRVQTEYYITLELFKQKGYPLVEIDGTWEPSADISVQTGDTELLKYFLEIGYLRSYFLGGILKVNHHIIDCDQMYKTAEEVKKILK